MLNIYIQKLNDRYDAVIDTGSPISLTCIDLVKNFELEPSKVQKSFRGINNSHLLIIGNLYDTLEVEHYSLIQRFHVVPDNTMSSKLVLGRDFIVNSQFNCVIGDKICLTPIEMSNSEILLIGDVYTDANNDLNIEPTLSLGDRLKVTKIFNEYYVSPTRPIEPTTSFKLTVNVKPDITSFYLPPRRVSYAEKEEVTSIVNNLLNTGVIKPSTSEFASRIVLVKKKNKTRMCVDFRD